MYEIDNTCLIFSGGKRCRFSGDIAEVLDFDHALVVRLVETPISVIQNIYGLDHQGNVLWQIPRPVSFPLQSPFVRVSINGGRVDALNWDGHIVTLHPQTGQILHEQYSPSHAAPTTRRTASLRRWL